VASVVGGVGLNMGKELLRELLIVKGGKPKKGEAK
jgi:hypothetical protein